MAPASGRMRRFAAGSLLASGLLLLVVAALHLAMTSEIGRLVQQRTSEAAYDFLWPPYALDHVVVGILLAAVGSTALACAGGVRTGERRALWIALIDALAVLALSPAILLTVGLRYFSHAPVFAVAAAIVCLVGAIMVVPLLLCLKRPDETTADRAAGDG